MNVMYSAHLSRAVLKTMAVRVHAGAAEARKRVAWMPRDLTPPRDRTRLASRRHRRFIAASTASTTTDFTLRGKPPSTATIYRRHKYTQRPAFPDRGISREIVEESSENTRTRDLLVRRMLHVAALQQSDNP